VSDLASTQPISIMGDIQYAIDAVLHDPVTAWFLSDPRGCPGGRG
jgi:hypothetical protein